MRFSQDFHMDYIMVVESSRIGMTYHAVLRDGSALTVKRLYGCLLSEKQFRAEMGRIGQIRHPNLVLLLGYCVVEEEKLLIYKHMANGALSLMIRDWARVVLLDEEYEPRVTNFGLARLMRPLTSDEGLNTTPFLNGDFGEFGEFAPEYATNPVSSTKGDVYGFGVVLLELVTGQKATEGSHYGSAYQLVVAGKIREAIDKPLRGNRHDDQIVEFLKVACGCEGRRGEWERRGRRRTLMTTMRKRRGRGRG
ncbi:probable inactive receptor kinase At1g27190 [Asparagus officinalis]|uniref:probable inactive receptor kinase At1g27190 n=1 Tax=Asparagus officinalis TaxID=4686 RepID=UPI00098DE76A|nr:probable inactive receptor kinase At1g27190 [Asparagus officinalis]